jgi:hypothetical protein
LYNMHSGIRHTQSALLVGKQDFLEFAEVRTVLSCRVDHCDVP